MQTFQTLQAVKVNNEASAHHGEAGSVRSGERPGKTKNAAPVVNVQLDSDEAGTLREFALTDLQAL